MSYEADFWEPEIETAWLVGSCSSGTLLIVWLQDPERFPDRDPNTPWAWAIANGECGHAKTVEECKAAAEAYWRSRGNSDATALPEAAQNVGRWEDVTAYTSFATGFSTHMNHWRGYQMMVSEGDGGRASWIIVHGDCDLAEGDTDTIELAKQAAESAVLRDYNDRQIQSACSPVSLPEAFLGLLGLW